MFVLKCNYWKLYCFDNWNENIGNITQERGTGQIGNLNKCFEYLIPSKT